MNLLSILGGFSERAYLAFLRSCVPDNIADKIPEEPLCDLDRSEVLEPLLQLRFPREKLDRFSWYFSETMAYVVCHVAQHHPGVVMYLCSVNLHLHAMNPATAGDMEAESVAAITHLCRDLDAEGKMHVLKFLLWLDELANSAKPARSVPSVYFMVGVSALWSSTFVDLVDVTCARATNATCGHLDREKGVLALLSYDLTWRSLLGRMFGADGALSQAVGRLRGLLGQRGWSLGRTEGGEAT